MNDCPNADVRDLLPDLLHARLDAATGAMVEAHVAACADCAAELDLLRQMRAARRTPRVDVSSIVAAVPAYRAPARRTWVGWRAAAAITVLVAGASSIALLQRGTPSSVRINSRAIEAPAPTSIAQGATVTTQELPGGGAQPRDGASVKSPARTESKPVTAAPSVSGPARELAVGGGALGDLDDRELTSLLKDIESLDAVPSVDVESTPTSPIAPSTPASP